MSCASFDNKGNTPETAGRSSCPISKPVCRSSAFSLLVVLAKESCVASKSPIASDEASVIKATVACAFSKLVNSLTDDLFVISNAFC